MGFFFNGGNSFFSLGGGKGCFSFNNIMSQSRPRAQSSSRAPFDARGTASDTAVTSLEAARGRAAEGAAAAGHARDDAAVRPQVLLLVDVDWPLAHRRPAESQRASHLTRALTVLGSTTGAWPLAEAAAREGAPPPGIEAWTSQWAALGSMTATWRGTTEPIRPQQCTVVVVVVVAAAGEGDAAW